MEKKEENPDFVIEREKFVFHKSEDITKDYDICDTLLGKGSFGSVLKGIQKSTGQERALKFIPRTTITRKIKRFLNEVGSLK